MFRYFHLIRWYAIAFGHEIERRKKRIGREGARKHASQAFPHPNAYKKNFLVYVVCCFVCLTGCITIFEVVCLPSLPTNSDIQQLSIILLSRRWVNLTLSVVVGVGGFGWLVGAGRKYLQCKNVPDQIFTYVRIGMFNLCVRFSNIEIVSHTHIHYMMHMYSVCDQNDRQPTREFGHQLVSCQKLEC